MQKKNLQLSWLQCGFSPEEPATPGDVSVLSLYYLVVLHLNRVGCKKGSSSLGMSDLPLFLGSLCSAEGNMVCDLDLSRSLGFKAAVSPKEVKTLTYRIIRMMFFASMLLWLSCWFQITGTLGTVLFTKFWSLLWANLQRSQPSSLFFLVLFFVFNPVIFWLAKEKGNFLVKISDCRSGDLDFILNSAADLLHTFTRSFNDYVLLFSICVIRRTFVCG